MELNKTYLLLRQWLNRRLKWFFASSRNGGFSLVELIVTISIVVIITSLLFVSYPKFREKVSLKKTAQEIALAIRQAQTYGLAVREYQTGNYPGYGVHFDINSPDSFILFANVIDPENNVYNPGEDVELLKILTGERITDLCISPPSSCTPSTIDIVFFRPNPIVTIKANGSIIGTRTEINVSSLGGQQKKIVVLSTGQISVESIP